MSVRQPPQSQIRRSTRTQSLAEPRWDTRLKSYALPFFGRVKLASAKNFQLAKLGSAESYSDRVGACILKAKRTGVRPIKGGIQAPNEKSCVIIEQAVQQRLQNEM